MKAYVWFSFPNSGEMESRSAFRESIILSRCWSWDRGVTMRNRQGSPLSCLDVDPRIGGLQGGIDKHGDGNQVSRVFIFQFF